MKAWVGFLGLFGLGAGVGFCAGIHFEQRRKQKEEKEALQKQMEEEAKQCDAIQKDAGYIPDESEPEDDMEKTASEMDEYLSIFEHPEEEDTEEPDETKEEGKTLDDSIELFFDEQRWDEETDFQCHELTYYAEDGVVCDEDDHNLEDYEDLIGNRAIVELINSGCDMIFARNSWSEDLYKITLKDDAYGRAVLGLDIDQL